MSEQSQLWNGPAGRAWVDTQELLDAVFRPFEELLVEEVSRLGCSRVLDVGCGTGGTTLAVSRRLGAAGRCTGIDISEPMIEAARARAEREGLTASFVCANAEDHVFAPASFDMVLSRFGVMFFDDSVRAFSNLRAAATERAHMRCIAFRSAAENPFMTTAERAAAPFLPEMPARRPDGPGQFAFADAGRVRRILEESGWNGIEVIPIDVDCVFPEAKLPTYLSRLGPLGLALQNAEVGARQQIIEAVRRAFDPFVQSAEVRFTASCWMLRSVA